MGHEQGKPKQRFAIKEYKRELARCAFAEANALLGMDHPSIVRLVDFIERENSSMVVREFRPGIPYWDFFRMKTQHARKTYPDADLMFHKLYVLSFIEVLAHIHERGFTHNDFCGSNIVVDKTSGEFSVIDFGSSKRSDEIWKDVWFIGIFLLPVICRTDPEALFIDDTKLTPRWYDNLYPVFQRPTLMKHLETILGCDNCDRISAFDSIRDLKEIIDAFFDQLTL